MFRGEKVQLAAVQREYLPKYVEWLNDWEVAQFLMPGILAPFNLDDEIEWYENRHKKEGNYLFAILTLAENKLIGNCGLHKVDLKNRSAIFGILIGEKDYWGKGYGTDATRTLIRFGFEELGLNRVELEVYDFNPRAIRAYEKAGFRRDGVHRQGLYRMGQFHDEIIMSILREEWDVLNHTKR
jgi:RimJ/RimL family protein N-acetyltransferase